MTKNYYDRACNLDPRPNLSPGAFSVLITALTWRRGIAEASSRRGRRHNAPVPPRPATRAGDSRAIQDGVAMETPPPDAVARSSQVLSNQRRGSSGVAAPDRGRRRRMVEDGG